MMPRPAAPASLPDPLVCSDGSAVESPETWRERRRPEILELFRRHVYGRAPEAKFDLASDVLDEGRVELGGGGVEAARRQVAIDVTAAGGVLRIELLIFLPPSAAEAPVPVFVLLNFGGNHAVRYRWEWDAGIESAAHEEQGVTKAGAFWSLPGQKRSNLARLKDLRHPRRSGGGHFRSEAGHFRTKKVSNICQTA